MAAYFITNITSGKYYPAGNPINFTVNSNNTGNCNFRYVARIFINNTFVFSSKLFPDPTTGYGFFQVSRIIQDWITNSVPKSPYTAYFNAATGATIPAALTSFYIKIGEEYDTSVNCDGTVISYLDQVTSNTAYAINAALPYEDWPTSNLNTTHLMGAASTTKKFLTNSPRTIDITNNDSYYLDFLWSGTMNSSVDAYLTINFKNGSTSQLALPSGVLTALGRFRLACGIFDINKVYGSTLIDWATVNTYTIYLRYSSVQISETFTFKVKPPKPFETRIAWINQMGGIDHFTFYHRNRKTYAIDRKTFKKSLSSNYSNSWTYQVGDREDTTYDISANQNHSVSSFCNRYDAEWLSELFFSPDVWTYNYNDPCATITTWSMLPIVVNTNSVTPETQRISKPYLVSLDYSTAYTKNLIK